MILGILVLITALAISAVAIFYSVAGLVAIFAGAAIPIIIMGSTLEIAKLVTAVWLHRYWNKTVWWLKGYLSAAIIVLMLITSLGIFGFLSSAHIEQTSKAQDSIAQIARIEDDLQRQSNVIQLAEQTISTIRSSGTNADAEIQSKIEIEQSRIDSTYLRMKPAIDEQLALISNSNLTLENRITPLLDQVASINANISALATALSNNDIQIAQGIAGAVQDGKLGSNTSSRIQSYRETQETARNAVLLQVDAIRSAPRPEIVAARDEISRLRSLSETQIEDSNRLISRVRLQLGIEDTNKIDNMVDLQQIKINNANNVIENLIEQKSVLQIEYRKLEAEVGPIKYLAEFVYGGTADADLLEKSVQWVILLIIFVFDPLAVLLLIASQTTFKTYYAEKLATEKELAATEQDRITLQNNQFNFQTQEILNRYQPCTESHNQYVSNTSPSICTPVSEPYTTINQTSPTEMRDTDRTSDYGGDSSERMDEFQLARYTQLVINEQDDTYKTSKNTWKLENPTQNIKFWKDQYIKGKITSLPWDVIASPSIETE